MNNSKLNDEVSKIALEIGKLHRKMIDSFPLGNDHILKHFASSSIHLAFFMRDYSDVVLGRKSPTLEKEIEFLNTCGCDFNKDKN